jgi:hypothetical protein
MIKKQHVKSRNVCKLTFELPEDIGADEVQLLAEFNGWQPVPFERLKSGKWKLVQEAEPGRDYEFRYRLLKGGHERYLNDEGADRTVTVAHGVENAVISC